MNNEQAIKYISENSKNPHAAMIAEWLLTGWDVEYLTNNEEWAPANRPSWNHYTKYRLVRKPAYRVYIDKDGDVMCARRSADGAISQGFKEVKWLSDDWIEYDPKQWPTPLVERIAAIDIKAAEWIVDNWDELLEDRYTRGGTYRRDSNTLGNMFFFGSPPQGIMYWADISIILGE